ncbi:hypothetical protein SAMCCGM7_pA0024 (plasmid) [Sinorhizobium americanum CCGM7]|nr:hypothetical protein SAMCCGM7_pA0024 [Sinorhizobium americanum CCGM7]
MRSTEHGFYESPFQLCGSVECTILLCRRVEPILGCLSGRRTEKHRVAREMVNPDQLCPGWKFDQPET